MKLLPLCLVLMLAVSNSAQAADALLSPNKPIQLTGTKGKFDFIKIDSTRRRLLACHTGNASLDVIDLDSGKLLASVPTGNAQGVAIDDKGGRYFVSCSKPPQLAIVDATTFTVTGEVPVPSAADVCAYSPVFDRVVVDSDEKPQQWWIDPQGEVDREHRHLSRLRHGRPRVRSHRDVADPKSQGHQPSRGSRLQEL